MHLAPAGAALRARKPRPLRKVDPQIKPPLASIELEIHHRPRILKTKRSLKQVKILHAAPIIAVRSPTGCHKTVRYPLKTRRSRYMPSPVRAVEIPKDHGTGVRVLGVPTTADRIAQTAAAMLLEEKLEAIFHPDSYGYRPGRSAHDALAVTRQRCWKQAWVLDLDIRAFFDSVPHDLLLKAVAHHTRERWVLLYIERWLKAPMQMPDGTLVARERGTPARVANLTVAGQLVHDVRV
jgi:hypothetical protein